MRDYHINISFSEGDNGYVADIPDLQYCSAFGMTPELALAEALTAKEAWLATVWENGVGIPAPVYCPAIYRVS